jgi:hypothetical protein
VSKSLSADGATKTAAASDLPAQIALATRLAKGLCPPGQGMPGRVYQIDAGWMGGAASIGYRQRSFTQVELGISVSTDIGVASLGKGSKIFENVDLMPGIAHFPRNSRRLGVKKPMLSRVAQRSLPDTTGKCSRRKIHYGDGK